MTTTMKRRTGIRGHNGSANEDLECILNSLTISTLQQMNPVIKWMEDHYNWSNYQNFHWLIRQVLDEKLELKEEEESPIQHQHIYDVHTDESEDDKVFEPSDDWNQGFTQFLTEECPQLAQEDLSVKQDDGELDVESPNSPNVFKKVLKKYKSPRLNKNAKPFIPSSQSLSKVIEEGAQSQAPPASINRVQGLSNVGTLRLSKPPSRSESATAQSERAAQPQPPPASTNGLQGLGSPDMEASGEMMNDENTQLIMHHVPSTNSIQNINLNMNNNSMNNIKSNNSHNNRHSFDPQHSHQSQQTQQSQHSDSAKSAMSSRANHPRSNSHNSSQSSQISDYASRNADIDRNIAPHNVDSKATTTLISTVHGILNRNGYNTPRCKTYMGKDGYLSQIEIEQAGLRLFSFQDGSSKMESQYKAWKDILIALQNKGLI
mmetsp:Transcript_49666/g.44481  ORF Transcript_49666/g.44481 Transcript_49666/m.44481 type:complete len:432 (-) Transcript_49666:287-1582(-)